MKSLLTTLLFTLLTVIYCNAQQFTIKGTAMDTLTLTPLPNATVTVVHASDSIMENFTRAKENGTFEVHIDSAGKYIVIVTFPGFADFVDEVDLNKSHNIENIGVVPMVSRTHLLQEFVLTKQISAIKVKGDTVEYIADSFKVKDNATVEDLLKRLPGLEVDKNGKVTAQGQTVQKILVDGEEFFSDDPAVVTKSLQAKIIDKVQVFDKKSDQAEFTGIDDGQKTKTINLQLKEDKKQGYFGKVSAGGGTDGYFENEGMINSFKGKQQLSAFGIMSNTAQIGLGWEDANKYGSSNTTTEINDDGEVSTFTSSENDFQSWDGTYNGQGLPTVWTGGLHYANKWDQDKDHVTGNYRFAKQNVEMEGNTITQYVLPDSQYFTKDHTNQFSTGERHGLNGMYELAIDSSSSIKLTVDAGYRTNQISSLYNDESLTATGDTINHSTRKITSDATSQIINSDLLYRKKFKKKGRTLSVDFKENYTNSQSSGFLNSDQYFANADNIVDQRKDNASDKLAFASKLVYTEPLSKVAYLELNYGLSLNNSIAKNDSYDKLPGDDSYSFLDTFYSSDYKYNILNNSGGANVRFVYKKINFSFGSNIADTKYIQEDLYRDTSYRYDYFNLFPKTSFVYKIDKQASLNLNYYGNSKQPTIDQITPLHQNTDPLNIAIGNPNLKQEFHNTISGYYNSYKVLSGQWIYANISFTSIKDAISQATNVDSIGRRTYQYINVDGNYNAWGYLAYGYKIPHTEFSIGGNANMNLSHVTNYVNNEKNISDNNGYTVGLNLSYYKDKKYDVEFRPSVTYNDNKATISTYATSYWESDNTIEANVQLPLKFEISTEMDIQLRQRTVIFDRNNNVVLWKAYVGKKFLKSGQLELRATVKDILNQNIGYTRYAQNNYITENTYNTIGRYGMIKLIWNFSKTVGSKTQNATINLK